jgi:S-adenosylmethionine synthetase
VARSEYLFTSESVSEGHPDKVCDRISDAIVDAYLAAQPDSRVAVETMVTTNRIVLAGEVRGPESITHQHLEEIARHAVRDIGYEQEGFHWKHANVEVLLHPQSPDIALGVELWKEVDVVLSGINLGPNLGNSMWHSGTLAAAKQAALLGLRGRIAARLGDSTTAQAARLSGSLSMTESVRCAGTGA